jgi:CheY-like chemotaxis protein
METKSHILVVDDDAALRHIMIRLLQGCGYRVTCAADGNDALAFLRREERVDLILLDLKMSGLDGWEFRRIQKADPKLADIPVMIVSGVINVPGNRVGLDAAAYFEKPVDVDQLLEAIQRVLQGPPHGRGIPGAHLMA